MCCRTSKKKRNEGVWVWIADGLALWADQRREGRKKMGQNWSTLFRIFQLKNWKKGEIKQEKKKEGKERREEDLQIK